MADSNLTVEFRARDQLSGELKKLESGVIRFVGAVSSALTAIATIGFPIVEAAKFQKELLEAAKTTDFSRDQTTGLRLGLVDLSKQIDVTASDLAKIATMGGQLGIGQGGNVQALLSFTTEVARAVTALDVSAELASTALGKMINIFNLQPDQFRSAISALNQVSNTSNATADQLFDVVRRIGNLGGSVDFPEAVALSAAMIDLGLTAETAGTTVTKIFADMKSRAADFAQFTSMSMDDWIDIVSNDGLRALDIFLDRLNSLPAATAAAAKVELTGGGRIFEAVTKLQEQRARAQRLAEQAANLEASIAERQKLVGTGGEVGTASQKALDIDRQRVQVLKDLALRANVVTRLEAEARAGYLSGASAAKEQQTVLTGLSRQWVVFMNRVRALGIATGEVILTPLTNFVKSFGESLDDATLTKDLAEGVQDIIDGLSLVREIVGDVVGIVDVLGSSGLDWGSFLRFGALLAGVATLKLFVNLMGAMAGSVTRALPALGAAGRFFVGTKVAAEGAARATGAAGEQAARTGGVFQRFSTFLTNTAGSLMGVERAQQQLARTQSRLANATSAIAQREQALAAVRNRNRAGLRDVASLTAAIIEQDTRRYAAETAGERRRAAGHASQAARLRRDRLALVQAEEKVTQARRIADNLGERATQQQASITQGANRASTALLSMHAAAQRAATTVASVGRGAQASFADASRVIAQGGGIQAAAAALTSRLRGAMTQGIAGQGLTSALSTAMGKVRNFAAASALVLQGAYAGANKGGGPVRNIVSGTAAATAALAGSIGTSLGSAVASGAARALPPLNALTAAAGRLAGSFFGVGDAWSQTSSNVTRSVLVVQGAFNALGKVVRFVGTAVSRLVNVFFFAVIIKEMLDFLGLWQGLVNIMREAALALGFAEGDLPQWMQSADEVEETANAITKMTAAMQAAIDQSGKFNAEIASVIASLSDSAVASEALTFNIEDPEKATRTFLEGLDAVLIGYSELQRIADARVRTEGELNVMIAKQKLLIEQQARGANSGPSAPDGSRQTNLFNASAQKAEQDIQRLGAAMSELISDLNELAVAERDVSTLTDSVRNLFGAAFTSTEATRLFGVQVGTTTSLFQEWAHATARVKEEQALLAAEESKGLSRTDGNVEAAAQAQQKYADTLGRVRGRILSFQDRAEELRKEMRAGALDTATFDKAIAQMNKSLDPRPLRELSLQLANLTASEARGGDIFKGITTPTIESKDVFEAGAGIAVVTNLKKMYDTWASMAKTAAESAKNYAAAAIKEVKQQAEDAQKFVDNLRLAFEEQQRAAKNQTLDRTSDANLRKQNLDIDQREARATREIERRYAGVSRVLAEQEQGGIRVTAQAQKALELKEKELFAVREKFNLERQGATDTADASRTRRDVNDSVRRFNELTAKAREYKEQVKAANDIMNNPNLPDQQRSAANVQREEGLRNLLSLQEQLRTSAEAIAKTPPVGGKLLVSEQQIDAMGSALTALTSDIGKLTLESAGSLADIWSAEQKRAETASQSMSVLISKLTKQFEVMARAGGETFAEAADRVAPILGASEQLAGVLGDIRELTSQGLIDPGVIDPAAIQEWANQMRLAVGESAAAATPPLELTVDQTILGDSVRTAIQAGLGASATEVNVKPSQSSLAGIVESIGKLDITIKLKGVLTSLKDASGTNVTVPQTNARGGAIGFDEGGKVSGPGTGTSDSILSWLSNGEFVMDALTTSRFGSGFFAMLQKIARGGKVANFMQKLRTPGFARGGSVRLSSEALADGFANDFKSTSEGTRDMVDINLNRAGKKVTIQAERQQVRALVDMLKTFED